MRVAEMKQVEIRVRDEAGKVISEQALELDIGTGRFEEIERAVEGLRRQALKRLEGDLLEREQRRFIEAAKKGGSGG
jgi:hypothetical protein